MMSNQATLITQWRSRISIRDWPQNKKQQIAIAALPMLVLVMLGVYQADARLFGSGLGWYVGFLFYWPVWCVLYPLWMLGWDGFRGLFRSRRLRLSEWGLMFFYPAMAFIGTFLFEQRQREISEMILYVFMSFGNGFFEEILWRGVYIKLFPEDKLWGFLWPTLWFAIWHYAPGSISPWTNVWVLMGGALGLGACVGWLAMKTDSIRWSMISHTLSGLIWGIR
jgi:membrane protease YdiL (CAAX protease family)